jgi:hypothetical protein
MCVRSVTFHRISWTDGPFVRIGGATVTRCGPRYMGLCDVHAKADGRDPKRHKTGWRKIILRCCQLLILLRADRWWVGIGCQNAEGWQIFYSHEDFYGVID